jgi:hypothetical protein
MMDPGRKPLAVAVLLAGLLAAPSPQPGIRAGGESGAPINLRVETFQVGPGGTETLAADEARLLPGKAALLVKEVTLSSSAGSQGGSEKLSVKVEIRTEPSSSSRLVMKVSSRVNVLASTGGIPLPKSEIRREVTAVASEGASQLFEIYASSALKTKLALNVRWFSTEEGEGGDEEQVPIPLKARVYEVEGANAILLRENQLLAAVGGRAEATFNRSVSLPGDKQRGKRVRQDRVELALSPRYQIGRSLSLTLEVTGEVVTLTEDGDISHPVSLREDLLLTSGVPSTVEIDRAAEDPGREGWEQVHFRLEIMATF